MNSPTHHIRKSYLYDSSVVNCPTPLVNLNNSSIKRPSINIKTENSSTELRSGK